ncbi:MAG: hypothetical protein ACW99F_17940 [Candidatus Hodarchaeales archaeon]|jgi:hypothetical protein
MHTVLLNHQKDMIVKLELTLGFLASSDFDLVDEYVLYLEEKLTELLNDDIKDNPDVNLNYVEIEEDWIYTPKEK